MLHDESQERKKKSQLVISLDHTVVDALLCCIAIGMLFA